MRANECIRKNPKMECRNCSNYYANELTNGVKVCNVFNACHNCAHNWGVSCAWHGAGVTSDNEKCDKWEIDSRTESRVEDA